MPRDRSDGLERGLETRAWNEGSPHLSGPSPLLRIAWISAAIVIGAVVVGSQLSTGSLSRLLPPRHGDMDTDPEEVSLDEPTADEYGAEDSGDDTEAEEAFLDESADETAGDDAEVSADEEEFAPEDEFASEEDDGDEAEEGDPDEL